MSLEKTPRFSDLNKAEKGHNKPINSDGAYVAETAIEDPLVAHRIALLENEAFEELEAKTSQNQISIDEILGRLADKNLKYDEKSELTDMLFQRADLERLRGNSVDDELVESLKKTYTSLVYSKILTTKLTKGIAQGDTAVIGEVLKDGKFYANWEVFSKLSTDEERRAAFLICKERARSACDIIKQVKDIDMALTMYDEVLQSSDKESYSDKSVLDSTGCILAEKLFSAGKTEKLVDLLRTDTFKLAYYKDFMNLLGAQQVVIIEMVKQSSDANDIIFALKFVTEPGLLRQLAESAGELNKLDEESLNKVLAQAEKIEKAVAGRPTISILSTLKADIPDDDDDDEKTMVPKNKFVVGIKDGKYIIAMSSVDAHEYHRNIFDSLGGTVVRSGGYLGFTEQNGKITVRMVRSSGDFGRYSQELLELYRNDIEEALRKTLETNELELIIKISSSYG